MVSEEFENEIIEDSGDRLFYSSLNNEDKEKCKREITELENKLKGDNDVY